MKKRLVFHKTIGGKILIIFSLICIVSVSVMIIVQVNYSSASLKSQAYNQLEAVQSLKHKEIEDFFQEALNDITILKETDDVMQSIESLIRYHNEMEMRATGEFVMNGSGENVSKSYTELYAEANGRLAKYCEIYGYNDVLLICYAHGHVMYSWAEDKDLGTNLGSGPYNNSPLGKLWKNARQSEKPVIVDMAPYAASENKPVMFLGAAVKKNGNPIGVVALRISTEKISYLMNITEGMGETGEIYLVGKDNRMRSNSRIDTTGKHTVEASFKGTVQENGVDTLAVKEALSGNINQAVITSYMGNKVLSSWNSIDFDTFKWAVIAEISESEIHAPINKLLIIIFQIGVAILIVVIFSTAMFSRSISKPLFQLVQLGERISDGDFPESDLTIKSGDEIGILAEVFNRVVNTLKTKSRELELISEGDLSVDIKFESDKDKFAASFDRMLRALNEIIAQVNTSVEQVSIGSNQVSQSSQSLSQGAAEQASSLEQISASINEIAGQARQNAENAIQANALARQATENAETGNSKMMELLNSIQRISDSSDAINKVVKVIDDIAFQINLLALNANVEAARAGKYGKGFAVVADEVRSLAVKSADSVRETTSMVEETLKNIEVGSSAAEQTAEQLAEIVTGSTRVADLVEEIAAASKEQAQGIDQINIGLEQVDQVTQSNTANAEESASAAEELASQGEELSAMISVFKLKDTQNEAGNNIKINKSGVDKAKMEQLIREELQRMGKKKTSEAKPGKAEAPNQKITGVKPYKEPSQVIHLDDDDFGNF